jgi:hypothetical protein
MCVCVPNFQDPRRSCIKFSILLQPEVLSRCCTPLSPGGSMLANSIANIAISDLPHSLQTSSSVLLPFVETDTSAASKQEHVISVVSSIIVYSSVSSTFLSVEPFLLSIFIVEPLLFFKLFRFLDYF